MVFLTKSLFFLNVDVIYFDFAQCRYFVVRLLTYIKDLDMYRTTNSIKEFAALIS